MRYPNTQITLKNDKALTLRSPEAADAEAMLEYLKMTAAETHFLLRYPEEVTFTLDEERKILTDYAEAGDRMMLNALDGDRIIGNAAVTSVGTREKQKHRAGLAIAILEEYWGLGLGTILLKEIEGKAREMGFTQLELGVFSDNGRAQRLYEKAGFIAWGTLPDAFRLKDGTFRDEIQMVKKL